MAKKKRTNPNRQPRTEADVERARNQTRSETIEDILVILFTALRDEIGMSDDEVYGVHLAMLNVGDTITKGYATIPTLRWTLRHEGGFEFVTGPMEAPKKKEAKDHG